MVIIVLRGIFNVITTIVTRPLQEGSDATRHEVPTVPLMPMHEALSSTIELGSSL